MSGRKKNDGLSEVIGFILIIAILVVIASLYVTYVVPAQGREAEIEHMTYIKNQFVDFKLAVDSLWINQETNLDISQNIEMGTLGQKTEGEFVFLPLANPVGSDGEMSVSALTTSKNSGNITITINGLFKDVLSEEIGDGAGTTSSKITINPDLYTQMQYYQALYPANIENMIPITIPNDPPIDPNDFSVTSSLDFFLLKIYPNSTTDFNNPNWSATFNLTRMPIFSVPSENASMFLGNKNPYYMAANYQYNLVMQLEKRNQSKFYPVFQNFTIQTGITLPKSDPILVNLLDPAYGLDAYGPLIVRDANDNQYNGTSNYAQNYDINISQAFNINQAFNITLLNQFIKSSYGPDRRSSGPEPMGFFSYIGSNYYWVNQEYIYQMGGVFLAQQNTEQGVVKLSPLISLGTRDGEPEVKITRLTINGVEGQVAGSTPVQVVSRITGIRKNYIDGQFLAPSPDNARQVTIDIYYPDNPGMVQAWYNAFNSMVYSANVSSSFNPDWRTIQPPTSTSTRLSIDQSGMNISLEYTEVDAEIILQPVGWQGS